MPHDRTAARSRPSRAAVVLFVVMIVIVMISLAGLSFVMTMSTENKAVHVGGDELQIEQVVASGTELLKAFSELPREDRRRAGGFLDNADLFQGVAVVGSGEGQSARFSVVSPRIDEHEISGVRFGAQNESARLNLMVLPQLEEGQPGAAREALMGLPDMTEPIADAILDWIDVDATPGPSGAEEEYYAGLGVPYRPRNGVPTSLEELLLVRDVSRRLLFGADADFNYQVEEAELQLASGAAGGAAGQGGLPWATLLTVYSAERNTSWEGKPRINLNEKDLAKLEKQLNEVIEPEWTKFILAYRQFGPLEESTEPESEAATIGPRPPRTLSRVRRTRSALSSGRRNPPIELDLSQPPKFHIDSILDLVGARVQLDEPDDEAQRRSRRGRRGPGGRGRAGVPPDGPPPGERPPRPPGIADEPEESDESDDRPPRIIESPFRDDRLAMGEYLPKLVDATTVSDEDVLRGRINVNEAPRAVLLGIPGLDRAAVDRIIAARGAGSGSDDPSRRYATWLVTEGIVDLEQMRTLLPYLTTGGDVFRAQVVGFFDDSPLSARAEVVVDGTASPPRQVYWKDLRLLGRGYSRETLGAEVVGDAMADAPGISGPMAPEQLE